MGYHTLLTETERVYLPFPADFSGVKLLTPIGHQVRMP